MTLVLGFVALMIALWLPDIVDLMVVGIGTIVIFVPVTLLALNGRSKPLQLSACGAWDWLLLSM